MFIYWFIIGGLIGGLIGKSRNNTVSGVVWGALLGPIGWIIVLLIDRRQRCPACRASVNDGATRCAHCGVEFSSGVTGAGGETDLKKCPYCAESVKIEAIKCRFCGSQLPEQPPVA